MIASRRARKLAGIAHSDIRPEKSATATISTAKGRKSWKGENPAEAVTTSSLSPLSRLSVKSVAMNKAIGEITITSEGMIRPVT